MSPALRDAVNIPLYHGGKRIEFLRLGGFRLVFVAEINAEINFVDGKRFHLRDICQHGAFVRSSPGSGASAVTAPVFLR